MFGAALFYGDGVITPAISVLSAIEGLEVAAPATYRLRLERETPDGAGQTIHAWSGIPHERVGPLLETLAAYLPWLARAAAARDAFRKVADLFR